MLSNNPSYQIVHVVDGINIYMPVDVSNGYHIERFVAATSQQMYSESGATKAVITEIVDAILKTVEDDTVKMVRTNVAVLANNLKTRLKYPVDEDCSLRMGAILTFIENENPDKVEEFWIQKKIALAHSNSDAYTFFLSTGIEFTKSYREQSGTSIDMQYFNKRREMLRGLLPA